MRRFLLCSNAVVVAASIAIFAATYFAKDQIEASARSALLSQAERVTLPMVDRTEAGLNAAFVDKWLPEAQRTRIEAEIAEYRLDPQAAIAKALTAAATVSVTGTSKQKLPALQWVSDKLDPWQKHLQQWYVNAVSRLLWDVRIFASTNIVAGLIAFFMARRASASANQKLITGSMALLFSLLVAVWAYIDSFSLWTFVFRSSVSWWYPALIGWLFYRLWLGRTLRGGSTEDSLRRQRPQAAT